MDYLVQGNLELRRGALLRIRDGRETVVEVVSGGVWITQEGDARDRFLAAGDWFRIDSAGVTLVSALGRASIALTAVQPPRLTKSWAEWFMPHARPTTASL